MSKVDWDYTALAQAYARRPGYAADALAEMFDICGAHEGMRACDVGAGPGHLTIPLLDAGMIVDAVEPNAAMRSFGIAATRGYPRVHWHDATGERTGLKSGLYNLVAFGSSFNVCDRTQALAETGRLLRDDGWFACMWNHRNLNAPLQKAIEETIRRRIENYDYGARRQDQMAVIAASALFDAPMHICRRVERLISTQDWIEAWRSHATLARQAGQAFEAIIDEIAALLGDRKEVCVEYDTNIWIARRVRC